MSTRRKWGDRKDGVWLKDLDSMHKFMPYIMPNRADAEAFIEESIDLTAINRFLAEHNERHPDRPYTLFQVVSAALLKTIVLRPALNRFVAGRRIYQRNYLSLAFVAKKKFSDHSAEALLMRRFDEDFTLDVVRDVMQDAITGSRSGKVDNSTNVLDVLTKAPRCVLMVVEKLLHVLDFFGRVPYALVKEEPNYSTLFLSNLGSIKLNAAYHHLNNWGTNSLFVVIGQKGPLPYFSADGSIQMRESLKLGITLDERIADGYYYARSIELFKYIMEHPELLLQPANTEVSYDK